MRARQLLDALDCALGDPYTDDASAVVIEIDGKAYEVREVRVQTWKHVADGPSVPIALKIAEA